MENVLSQKTLTSVKIHFSYTSKLDLNIKLKVYSEIMIICLKNSIYQESVYIICIIVFIDKISEIILQNYQQLIRIYDNKNKPNDLI